MAKISPTAAAKQWKASKTTIYKMMNDGELSFTLNEKGNRVLDTSELVRVLQPVERSEKGAIDSLQERLQRQNDDYIQSLKAQIAEQSDIIKNITSSNERYSLMLEYKPPQETPVSTVEAIPTPELVTGVEEAKAVQAKRKRSFFQKFLAVVSED